LPIRGGNWNNGANAGVFALNLNNPRSNANANIGFRAASPHRPEVVGPRAYFQCQGIKGSASLPRPAIRAGKRFKLPRR
jgi:hypothetical protein